ncbi:MAG: type I-A CRISPR-associated protein Cas4/Csa1 [Nitrososphaeria archaeon]
MLLLDKTDVDRKLKLLRQEITERGIVDELRGWNYDKPPLQPLSRSVKFGVSELAGRYCETLRDIYLKRVLGLKPSLSVKMIRGTALHWAIKDAVSDVKKFIYNNPDATGTELLRDLLSKAERTGWAAASKAELTINILEQKDKDQLVKECSSLYSFLIIQAAAKFDYALSKYPHAEPDSIVSVAVPPVTERKVDGALVGLASELSVDMYTPYNAIIDFKTGEVRHFHPLTAAGYALAIESEENIPIDFGFVVYLKFEKKTPSFNIRYFVVGDELRREFLEIRDEAFEIVNSGRDPGMPSKCQDFCPYYQVCQKG